MALTKATRASGLGPGDPAPGFELVDQNGKTHRLADYRGGRVVVYFYPKDDTPGCTTEACEFRDDLLVLKSIGAQLLAVSLDDAQSHVRFADKHGLPFPLLSDPGGIPRGRTGRSSPSGRCASLDDTPS